MIDLVSQFNVLMGAHRRRSMGASTPTKACKISGFGLSLGRSRLDAYGPPKIAVYLEPSVSVEESPACLPIDLNTIAPAMITKAANLSK